MAVLFFSKCRPQRADAWTIAQKAKRVFVGYPVRRREADHLDWRSDGVRSVFVDITTPDWKEQTSESLGRGKKAQITSNQRLAKRIGVGSVVLVPRVADGVCHVARVVSEFELAKDAPWADEYLKLRRKAGLRVSDELSHVGDVIQGWRVGEWDWIPFSGLPRWISYRLLSRQTAGIIHDLDDPVVSALDTVESLLQRLPKSRYQPLRDEAQTERALLDWVAPSALEHLVVALLQLEAPSGLYWHQVGGSGDGGVDGVAVSSEGELRAVLQCKWKIRVRPERLAKRLSARGSQVQVFVAALMGYQSTPEHLPSGIFWNRCRIAELVVKHKARLPFASSIGL